MAARSSHDLTRRYAKVDGHRIEYQWIGENPEGVPMVFLHEGLGSIELWRDFPPAVVAATGSAGLVYSRYGNGWSDPLSEPRRPDYMHVEALEVLPALIDRLVGSPPLLVGHSDGASIAVIYAGSGYPVEGLVLLAPHVFVEDCSVAAIEAIRGDFLATDLAEKMAKYHRDPAATFWGWNDIWLSPQFRDWNIEAFLTTVSCPLVLVQGEEDDYGTSAQLDAIETGAAGPVERVMVAEARHSPHLSHMDPVVSAIAGFVAGL